MTIPSTSVAGAVDDDGVREDERHRAFSALYPAATVAQPLHTSPHPVGVVAARSWKRVSLALLVAGLAVLLEIILLSGPTSFLGFGWFPLALGIGATVAGAAGLAWSHHALRPRGTRERAVWAAWARERGLVSVAAGSFTVGRSRGRTITRAAIGAADLHIEPSRRFTPMYRARLGDPADPIVAHLGTSFVHGPWGPERNLLLGHVAAVVTLPAAVRNRLPASTLDRFVRGGRPLAGRSGTRLRELRLESSDFDDACDLRVDAGSDDLEWYRLLDPTMLAGLARDWPVSWQQHGATLVVYVPAPAVTLDAVQLDTLLLATEAIARHFRDAATTAEPISLEVRERHAQRRTEHRRRRIAQNIASWAAVLAVLAVPIYLVMTLDAREDRARADAQRDRNAAFARDVELRRERDEVTYPVRGVAVAIATCAATCAAIDIESPAALAATGAVTDEQLRGVEVERTDGGTRVSSTTPGGITFAITWRGRDPEAGEFTCTPAGASSCPDGTWGDASG